MPELSKAEIEKVAMLARLGVSQAEQVELVEKLNQILKYIDQMNQVDTTHIEPLAHPLEVKQPLRQDKVTESDHREQLQACAPLTEAGLYLVPIVIE